MKKPRPTGWVIEFRTARNVFELNTPSKVDYLVSLCESGRLRICHREEELFKEHEDLREHFIKNQCCIAEPSEEMLERCHAMGGNVGNKKVLSSDDTALYLAGYAAENDFGVISDERISVFATVYDICKHYGITVMSSDKFFETYLIDDD